MDQKLHIKSGAHVVRVHRARISEAERQRRMESIRWAAAQLVVAARSRENIQEDMRQ